MISFKTLNDVVSALIGSIQPIGQTKIDDERYEAMQIEMNLINVLFDDIMFVAQKSPNYEYSVKRASSKALEYLQDKQNWIKEILDEVSE